jgi:hypothetical protein
MSDQDTSGADNEVAEQSGGVFGGEGVLFFERCFGF